MHLLPIPPNPIEPFPQPQINALCQTCRTTPHTPYTTQIHALRLHSRMIRQENRDGGRDVQVRGLVFRYGLEVEEGVEAREDEGREACYEGVEEEHYGAVDVVVRHHAEADVGWGGALEEGRGSVEEGAGG